MFNFQKKQFCYICGIVLSELFYKCRKCNKITCPSCQNKEKKCCINCAGVQPVRATTKRAPNQAFMRPVNLSTHLTSVVGEGPLPRSEVTKRLWEYIKEHGLQDSSNRRLINADEKLAAVFEGKTQVNMFEMTKLVARHMWK